MTTPETDLAALLHTLEPKLHEGVYVYCVLPENTDPGLIPAIATVREREGLTVIFAESDALRAGLQVLLRAAWITLSVHSELAAIGLTAAVSKALAQAGISCNVVAGAHHDHLFVPIERAEEALKTLQALQAEQTG